MSTIPGIDALLQAMGSCCSSTASTVSVPLPISNAPGLSAISYRIGTFTSFRQAMLDAIALPDLLSSAEPRFDSDGLAASPPQPTITVQGFAGFPSVTPFQIK